MTDAEPPSIPPSFDAPSSPGSLPEFAPDDTHCARCGYAVRGLATSSNCPECGTPVAHAMYAGFLAVSAPAYREQLARGFLLIAIGAYCALAITAGMIVLSAGLALLQIDIGAHADQFADALAYFAKILYSVVALLGWWMISTPDEGLSELDAGRRVRLLIRACVIGAALATIFELAVSIGLPSVFESAAQWITLVAFVARFFAGLAYIRWLAPRIPSRAIHQRAGKYRWLLPVVAITLAPCFAAGPIIAMLVFASFMLQVRRAILDVTVIDVGATHQTA